jgi:integrase
MLQRDRVRYYIKKPGKGRASYSILRDVKKPNGSRSSELFVDERIVAINKAFKAGQKPPSLCEIELQQIIKDLYTVEVRRQSNHSFNEDNLKLLSTYWEQEYADKEIIDHVSAKNDLKRAIEAVGSLSLYSASRDELQKSIDKQFRGNKQRRIVARLNQMLRYIKRDMRLRKAQRERRKVKYLTPAEFERILPHLPEGPVRALHVASFVTGCRMGEAFALLPSDFRRDVVEISKQMDRSSMIRSTKNRRERQAVVNPIHIDLFKAWIQCQYKEKLRNQRMSDYTKAACEKAFPGDPGKHCSFHDLRHSYAIWLLSKGVSLSLVAKSLGNSVTVAEEYYTGFSLSSDAIDAIKAILKG